MFSDDDQEEVVRFVFSKEENVELALAVMAAGQAIREKIIREFLTKLEDELWRRAKELGESWKVVNELSKDPFKRGLGLYLVKEDWRETYWVGLWSERGEARDFVLGIWHEGVPQGFDGGRIREALEGRVRSGITNDQYPFYIWADPYRDWADEATLSGLVGDRGSQAVRALSDTTLTIAAATEGIIDKLVRDWLKRPQKE